MARNVSDLVARLPELYQPVFGYPDLVPSRAADSPRVHAVLQVVDRLSSTLGRRLRVLDLGSAQGYLSLRIAELGHEVTGVEYLRDNVELACALAAEHPDLSVSFLHADIADVADLVDLARFDLVIAMSVLHHVADRDGLDAAVRLVESFSASVPNAVFELAVASEPVFWATSLPEEPRTLIGSYAWIEEIARADTHLSDVDRPVFFCSQSYVRVLGDLRPFGTWKSTSHEQSDPRQARVMRYYVLDDCIVKVATRFTDDADDGIVIALRGDLRRESRILGELAGLGIGCPRAIAFHDGIDETVLVRSTYPGRLLSKVVVSLTEHERSGVTAQVLDQLAGLETHGFFHADLRLWNVIFEGESGAAHLIDHGAIRTEPTDVMSPGDAHFSLLLFLLALWGGRADRTGLRRPRAFEIDAGELPARAVELVSFLLRHPGDDRLVRDTAARWREISAAPAPTSSAEAPIAWRFLVAGERCRRIVSDRLGATEAERDAAVADANEVRAVVATAVEGERRVHESLVERTNELAALHQAYGEVWAGLTTAQAALASAEGRNERLGEDLLATRTALDEALAGRDEARREHDRRSVEVESSLAEIAALRRTLSWRITAPLRTIRRFAPRPSGPA